jgi:hypothetical protein
MAEAVEVRVDPTPNPEAMKFTVNREVWAGRALTMSDPLQAFAMPLAARLFTVEGVKSLFFLRDFVTVTRRPGVEWEPLVEDVRRELEAHFSETS